jgi:hypothetical protein
VAASHPDATPIRAGRYTTLLDATAEWTTYSTKETAITVNIAP